MARRRRHQRGDGYHSGWSRDRKDYDRNGAGQQSSRSSDYPDWSCSCGTSDNYGWRDKCRSCGARAPTTSDGGARNAWQDKGSTEELRQLREELRKTREDNAQLRTGSSSPDSPVQETDLPKDCPSADQLDQEVRQLEEQLAQLRKIDWPGRDTSTADLERHIAYKRSQAHEAWPLPRRKARLEQRFKTAKDDVEQSVRQVKESTAALEELQKKLADQLQTLQSRAGRAKERHQELTSFLQHPQPSAPTPAASPEFRMGAPQPAVAKESPEAAEAMDVDEHSPDALARGIIDDFCSDGQPTVDKRAAASKRWAKVLEQAANGNANAKRKKGEQGAGTSTDGKDGGPDAAKAEELAAKALEAAGSTAKPECP